MLVLRPMTSADLREVSRWLAADHVARWWLTDTTAGAKLASYESRVLGADRLTKMFVVVRDEESIGFCQSYRWGDHRSGRRRGGRTGR